MRTVLLSWAAGLIAVISMAGCESLHRGRERQADCSTPASVAPVPINKESVAVRNLRPRNDVPWPTAPAITVEEKPEALQPPPRKIALNPQEKVVSPELPPIPETAKHLDVLPEKQPAPTVKEPVPEKIEIKSAPAETAEVGKFQSVVGQVQQFRNTWRLRYAPLDQDDVYGGSVLLKGASLDRLRDGQRIRVQGVLIPPNGRTSPALYRVQRLEILE